jgi:hypothetical protein
MVIINEHMKDSKECIAKEMRTVPKVSPLSTRLGKVFSASLAHLPISFQT